MQWKNIKQALKDAKDSNFFKLIANYETGEVWCDCREDSDSWCNYSNPAIFAVTSGVGIKNIMPITKISEVELIDLLNAFPDRPHSFINDAGITQLQEWQHDVEEYFQGRENKLTEMRL